MYTHKDTMYTHKDTMYTHKDPMYTHKDPMYTHKDTMYTHKDHTADTLNTFVRCGQWRMSCIKMYCTKICCIKMYCIKMYCIKAYCIYLIATRKKAMSLCTVSLGAGPIRYRRSSLAFTLYTLNPYPGWMRNTHTHTHAGKNVYMHAYICVTNKECIYHTVVFQFQVTFACSSLVP